MNNFGTMFEYVNEKADGNIVSAKEYISTDSMLKNLGGVQFGESNVPNGSVVKFKIGDTLFSNIRTYFRKVWMADRDGYCSNDILVFRGHANKIIPEFLFYILADKRFMDYSILTSKGAKMPRGDKVALRLYDAYLPDIRNQKSIAEVLKSLDDKIELNRQMNETLEEMARAIFKDWFVDFGPTRRKMAMKENGEITDPVKILGGLLPDPSKAEPIAAIFPDNLGDDGLPEGWKMRPLNELAKNHSATMDFTTRNSVIFVNTGDVLNGDFLHKNKSNVKKLPGQAKKIIEQGDILFSEIRPKNKRFAFVDFEAPDHVVSTKFMVIKSLGEITPEFLYFMLKQDETITAFNTIADSRSGTFPQITFESIKHYLMPWAGSSLSSEFTLFYKMIYQKQKTNKQESQTLAEMRDLLLPKLMSGEIRLRDGGK